MLCCGALFVKHNVLVPKLVTLPPIGKGRQRSERSADRETYPVGHKSNAVTVSSRTFFLLPRPHPVPLTYLYRYVLAGMCWQGGAGVGGEKKTILNDLKQDAHVKAKHI